MFEFPIVFAHRAHIDCELCNVEPALDPFDELARLINGGDVVRAAEPVRSVAAVPTTSTDDFPESPSPDDDTGTNALSQAMEDELRPGFDTLKGSDISVPIEGRAPARTPVARPDLPEALVPETEIAQFAEPLRVGGASGEDGFDGDFDLDAALSNEFEAALQADLEAAAAIERHVAQAAVVSSEDTFDQETNPADGSLAAVAPYAAVAPAARNWRMPVAAAAVLALGAGSAAAWMLAGSNEPAVAPLLVAEAGDAKVKPVEAGGQTALNSGSAVFETEQAPSDQNKLQGEIAEPVRTASVVPQRRKPIAVDARKVKTVVVKPDGTIMRVDGPARVVGQVAPAVAPKPTTPTTSDLAKAPSIDEKVATIKTAPVATADTVAVRKPVKAVANPIKPAVTKKAEPAVEVAKAEPAIGGELPEGTYVVQMASQRSQGAAEKSWSNLKRRYSGIIGSRGVNYQRKDLPGKGTYYRVRLVASSKSDARSVCSKLKGAGGSCFVTR